MNYACGPASGATQKNEWWRWWPPQRFEGSATGTPTIPPSAPLLVFLVLCKLSPPPRESAIDKSKARTQVSRFGFKRIVNKDDSIVNNLVTCQQLHCCPSRQPINRCVSWVTCRYFNIISLIKLQKRVHKRQTFTTAEKKCVIEN